MFSDKYVLKRNLADLLISNGAYDKAMALLNEIINKDSNPTWKAIVYFDKAKVQTLLKDYKSAIRNLKKSINTFDDSEHYMLYDAIYLLFKNYLQIQNPKAIDVLEELIEIKIDILKKNECFLSSEANLISQSEILNLIHYHINLNNNKIRTDYWFFIKNRDLSLDYNFYNELDSLKQDKLLKLKKDQARLYSLQQKSFIENNTESFDDLISKIELQYANIYKYTSCAEVYNNIIIRQLLEENEVLVDIAKVPVLNFTDLSKEEYNYYALIVEKNKPIKQLFIGSSESLNLAYSIYESYIQGRSKYIELNSKSYNIMFSLIDSSIDINKEIILFPEGIYNFINPLTFYNLSLIHI